MSRRGLGFSLVELMVAMALGLLVVGVVVAAYLSNSASLTAVEQAARHVENGRYAMQVLADDIRHAGFFGEFDAGGLDRPDEKPDPCATSPGDIGKAIYLHLQGYDDSAAGLACLDDVKDGTDVLVVRRTKTCVAGEGECPDVTAGAIYFQASQCETELKPDKIQEHYALDSDLTQLTKRRRDCATSAGLREVLVRIYFVANNSRAEDGIPTLKRWELGRGIVPLVEGIENLQIEYGIDANGDGVHDPYDANKDGVPDVYYAANPDDPDAAQTVENWRNVTAVRLHLLSREIKGTPGYKDDKTYRLGVDAEGVLKEVEPDDAALRHHVYSLVVVANNIAGRRQ